ncbi:Ribosomal protein L11 methyltransferase [Candidatus Bilamarchaeum dharawalense]|uniref:Ribosomal protein L11 methyltransferase n=1 Tax=Candidatus Bilamarchaeum dharawalense TaxID=2885759 RepID=A0A5E4LVB3_9ARCH|nr:Ribosomal protein L11 methyltransferase [Candidatus Bilamarchaeum dharawalense]
MKRERVISLHDTRNDSFDPKEHINFLKNAQRNAAFRKAFDTLAPDRLVLDVGTGSGIMAIYAALAGARKVIAVEKDERMARVAMANIRRHRLENRIKLIVGDALELTHGNLPPVDILIGEMLSTWCVVEPQVPIFRHLLGVVDGNPIIIPKRISNYVEGVQTQFGDSEGVVVIPTTYFELESTHPKAKKMTSRVIASEIGFSNDMVLDVSIQISLRALHPGIVNALRLTSITETCDGITFNPRDDTMPRMIVPLPEEIRLGTGQMISLAIQYTYGAGWENFVVRQN